MADTKISGLTALTGANTASGDLLTIVDISDTTMAASGTNKKITLTELQGAPVSAGTANGVLYLNGSKVATSGSALVFDGSNLGVGASATALGTYRGAEFAGTTATTGGFLRMRTSDSSVTSLDFLDVNGRAIFTTTNHPMRFGVNDTEAMRLTTTGLGIGTSSPGSLWSGAYKLVVGGGSGAAGATIYTGTGDAGTLAFADGLTGSDPYRGFVQYLHSSDSMLLGTSGTTKATLDSSGNLGLGVTPSAWGIGKVLQISAAGGAFLYGANGQSISGINAYYDTGWKYGATGYASYYEQSSGAHKWNTAASGTAGNAVTFTQAMTLDSSGNLGIGVTSIASKLHVKVTGGSDDTLFSYGANQDNFITAGSSGVTIFRNLGTERARIDSNGSFFVDTTSTGVPNDGFVYLSRATTSVPRVRIGHASGTVSGGAYEEYFYNGSSIGSVTQNGTTAVAYNTSSDYRLKNIDGPLTDSGAFIDALKPKVGTWKADGSKFVGFLAHEVQEVSPGSVVGQKDAVDEDGKPIMQAMEYGSAEFIANIVAELQSLRKRLADAGIA